MTEKIKPVRVQMIFSKQGNSAYMFFYTMKSMYPNIKITKRAGFTKRNLDMNVRWFNKSDTLNRTIEVAIYSKIWSVMEIRSMNFKIHDIRIGKPTKCNMCNGTGKSTYPRNRLW